MRFAGLWNSHCTGFYLTLFFIESNFGGYLTGLQMIDVNLVAFLVLFWS